MAAESVSMQTIKSGGLPFASRMVGSLLNEIGMESLICHSISECKYFTIQFYSDLNKNK
jgi:hypothetical protein